MTEKKILKTADDILHNRYVDAPTDELHYRLAKYIIEQEMEMNRMLQELEQLRNTPRIL